MKKENNNNLIAVAIIIAALLFVFLAPTQNLVVNTSPEARLNTVAVSGSFETDINPDLAEITFSIETEAKDASDAQAENSRLGEQVMDALKKAGVKADDLESTRYNIYPIREWNRATEKYEEKGYRVTHTIKVSVDDVDEVSKLLKVGVDSGANRVDNLVFKLSKNKENLIKTQVMKEAAQKASVKAKALADSLNIKIVRIHTVSENSYSAGIYYAERAVFAAAEDSDAAPAIAPEDVSVSASVTVVYEIA